jgi:hypothetical protein
MSVAPNIRRRRAERRRTDRCNRDHTVDHDEHFVVVDPILDYLHDFLHTHIVTTVGTITKSGSAMIANKFTPAVVSACQKSSIFAILDE